MMRKLLMLTIMFFCVSFSVKAEAASTTGKVGDIYHYGGGMLLVIGFDFGSTHCAGSNGGFRINADHPYRDSLLSVLLMAKATGKDVFVTADVPTTNCWAPTFTESNYLIVK